MECYLGTFCCELGACLYFSWNDFGNNLDGFSMLCGCHTDVSSGQDPVLSVATWQFFTTGHMGCLISGVGRRQQGGMRQTHVAGSGAVSSSDIGEHVVSRPPSEWSWEPFPERTFTGCSVGRNLTDCLTKGPTANSKALSHAYSASLRYKSASQNIYSAFDPASVNIL